MLTGVVECRSCNNSENIIYPTLSVKYCSFFIQFFVGPSRLSKSFGGIWPGPNMLVGPYTPLDKPIWSYSPTSLGKPKWRLCYPSLAKPILMEHHPLLAKPLWSECRPLLARPIWSECHPPLGKPNQKAKPGTPPETLLNLPAFLLNFRWIYYSQKSFSPNTNYFLWEKISRKWNNSKLAMCV